MYGVGATYNWDAWTVGLGWTRGDYEKAVGENGVGPFNAVHDDIALTAAYALAPGITVDGLLEYSRYRSNDAAGPDSSGLGVGLGTAITFDPPTSLLAAPAERHSAKRLWRALMKPPPPRHTACPQCTQVRKTVQE